jgi:hypothetical protein
MLLGTLVKFEINKKMNPGKTDYFYTSTSTATATTATARMSFNQQQMSQQLQQRMIQMQQQHQREMSLLQQQMALLNNDCNQQPQQRKPRKARGGSSQTQKETPKEVAIVAPPTENRGRRTVKSVFKDNGRSSSQEHTTITVDGQGTKTTARERHWTTASGRGGSSYSVVTKHDGRCGGKAQAQLLHGNGSGAQHQEFGGSVARVEEIDDDDNSTRFVLLSDDDDSPVQPRKFGRKAQAQLRLSNGSSGAQA